MEAAGMELVVLQSYNTSNAYLDSDVSPHVSSFPAGHFLRRFEDCTVLSSPLLWNLYDARQYKNPPQLMSVGLPIILGGDPPKDSIFQARMNDHKTDLIGVSLLSKVDPSIQVIQAIYCCPTSDLSNHMNAAISILANRTRITSKVYSAESVSKSHVAVLRPSVLLKMLTKRMILPGDLKLVIFDELDMMDYEDPVEYTACYNLLIALKNPSEQYNPQFVIFAASLNQKVKDVVKLFPASADAQPAYIFSNDEELSLYHVDEYSIRSAHFGAVLADILLSPSVTQLLDNNQMVVYVPSKHVSEVVNCLQQNSLQVGAPELADYDYAIDEFKRRSTQILVLSQYIDLGWCSQPVSIVINCDIPNRAYVNEDAFFIHRKVRQAGFRGQKGIIFHKVYTDVQEEFLQAYEKHSGRVVIPVEPNMESVHKVFNHHMPPTTLPETTRRIDQGVDGDGVDSEEEVTAEVDVEEVE